MYLTTVVPFRTEIRSGGPFGVVIFSHSEIEQSCRNKDLYFNRSFTEVCLTSVLRRNSKGTKLGVGMCYRW